MATLKTQYAILGLLKMVGAASGYQLKKAMSESTEYFWSEVFGSIYPTLKKLEDQGSIARIGTENTGKRTCIIYDITTKGEKALHDWLQLPPETKKPRNELLLKIVFSYDQPIDRVRQLIEAHQSQNEDKLAVFQLIHTRLLKDEPNSPELPFWLMTLRYGIIHARASIDWSHECLENLNTEK